MSRFIKRCLLLIILMSGVFFGACSEEDDNENLPYGFYGTVLNSQGQPISGVAIHLADFLPPDTDVNTEPVANHFASAHALGNTNPAIQAQLQQNYPNPFYGATNIPYLLDGTGYVNVTIRSWPDKDPLVSLVDAVQNAGYHTYIWQGKNSDLQPMTNGLYICRLEALSGPQEITLCLSVPADLIDNTYQPRATADAAGKFFLDATSIGFDTPVNVTQSHSGVISQIELQSQMEIVLIAAGYEKLVSAITFERYKVSKKSFTMIND